MPFVRSFMVALLLLVGAGASHAQTLTLAIGDDVTELEITNCRTDLYTTGRLIVQAEVTAVGSFRGQAAALFMTRSSSDDGAGPFSEFALYLTELSPERRTLPAMDAIRKISDDYESAYLQGVTEIQADYTQEKLAGLSPDEIVAKIMEQTERLDEHNAEMEARRVPYAQSRGLVTVDRSVISFEGTEMQVIMGEAEEAFADLGGAVSASAACKR